MALQVTLKEASHILTSWQILAFDLLPLFNCLQQKAVRNVCPERYTDECITIITVFFHFLCCKFAVWNTVLSTYNTETNMGRVA